MSDFAKTIEKAVALVQKKTSVKPQVGIILGTGLDALAAEIQKPERVAYADLPGFPSHMATTHKAEYVFGALGGKSVCAMAGRFHKYQGYSMRDITIPVWVMIKLGIKALVVSNACGGMREDHRGGDLFIITDHINLLGANPLTGLDEADFGNLFVDMLDPYDKDLVALTEKIAKAEGLKPKKGVYAAMEGPSLETRAEYAFLRAIGADVVGMSTVPEVIVARHAGVRVLGVACITDRCVPTDLKPVDIAHIIKTAQEAEPRISRVVRLVIEKMAL
jgi:purine-nucleoside phosphorylase